MEDDKLVGKITQALMELERQGELVLTTNFHAKAAKYILDSALADLFSDFGEKDAPIECTMPYLLEQTVDAVMQKFALPRQRARHVVGRHYDELLKRATVARIAEYYWHESPDEMAKRSYYHVELARDDREFDYLEWRQKH